MRSRTRSRSSRRCRPGRRTVWLRLTKTGTSYEGEYSFDGTTFTALADTGAEPDDRARRSACSRSASTAAAAPPTSTTSTVDGDRGGCEPPPPTNQAPQIQTATADPTIGFAPLPVNFTAAATDPDARRHRDLQLGLRRRRDTGLDGAEPVAHLHARPATTVAKLTVSDGEATRDAQRARSRCSRPTTPAARFRVLVFSKTAGFRHSSIDEGHAAIEQLGADNNFQVDHTEDATAFRDGILSHYDAVVWLSTTGDVLNDTPAGARSSGSSGPATATPASTRRPTRSTTGSGTASSSAPTS